MQTTLTLVDIIVDELEVSLAKNRLADGIPFASSMISTLSNIVQSQSVISSSNESLAFSDAQISECSYCEVTRALRVQIQRLIALETSAMFVGEDVFVIDADGFEATALAVRTSNAGTY